MLGKKLGVLVVLGLLGVVALLLACASPAEEGGQAPGGTATRVVLPTATPTPLGGVKITPGGILRSGSVAYAVPSWDPYRSTNYKGHTELNLVHAFLINFHYGTQYPAWNFELTSDGLAQSWEVSADGKTYTFHLRQGVKFQNRPPVNGRELVADDVKYSIEQIRDTPGSQQAWKFAIVEKIETPDKYTVVVRLKEPRASFLLYLGDPYSEIAPKETDLPGEGRARWYTAVGAGPFEIISEIPDVGQVYRKNPTYYRANEGLPHLDELRRMIISDDATTLAAFRAGQIDIRGINRLDLDSVKSTNPDIHCQEGEVSSATLGITFRMDKPPYNDIRVRQAIALAFNDQAVIDGNYLGYGIEQRGPINVAHPYYLEDQGECSKYYQYNVAEAKRLLTEAGYPNGFKDILNSTPGYGTTVVEYGEIVIDQMKQIGITLEYKLREYGSHVSTALQGKYDGMFWGYFYGSSFDPDDWLIAPFEPFTEAGGKNQAHVDDPKVLEMIYAQAKATNEEQRRQILNDIQRYLACQQYYIFWPRSYGVTCLHPWVYGYLVHAAFYSAGRIVEQVWTTEDAPGRKLALTKDAFPYDKFKK